MRYKEKKTEFFYQDFMQNYRTHRAVFIETIEDAQRRLQRKLKTGQDAEIEYELYGWTCKMWNFRKYRKGKQWLYEPQEVLFYSIREDEKGRFYLCILQTNPLLNEGTRPVLLYTDHFLRRYRSRSKSLPRRANLEYVAAQFVRKSFPRAPRIEIHQDQYGRHLDATTCTQYLEDGALALGCFNRTLEAFHLDTYISVQMQQLHSTMPAPTKTLPTRKRRIRPYKNSAHK